MTLWKQLNDYPALRAGILLALLGTGGVLVGVGWYVYIAPYRERGVRTDAQLLKKWSESKVTSRGRGTTYHYRFAYHVNGIRYQVEDTSGSGNLDRSGKVGITYLPEAPSRSILADSTHGFPAYLPYVFVPVSGLLAVPGWWIVAVCLVKQFRFWRLEKSGRKAEGRVTRVVRNTYLTLPGGPAQSLCYEFTGPDGEAYRGRTRYLPMRLLGKFTSGDQIDILYDPLNPERHQPDLRIASSTPTQQRET